MSKDDPLAKPFGMSEAEYQRRLRLSKVSHRIYMDMLNLLFRECDKLPAAEDRLFVLGGTSVMVAEHLSRILGGDEAMEREIAEARSVRKAMRRKQ